MALTTKGTWKNGVFGSGSIQHFTVGGVTGDFTEANLEALLKFFQTVSTPIIVGDDSGSTLHIAVENNALVAADLQGVFANGTGLQGLGGNFQTATVADFAY